MDGAGFKKDDAWGGLWRATLDGQGHIAQWDKVPVPIGDAMGMLWAFDSLYISGEGPEGRGIYRLKDSKGADTLDSWMLFKKIPGGSGEHGAHALVLGPDGKSIYIVHGNATPLIEGTEAKSPYRNYAEDDLLPRVKDPVATFFDKVKAPYGYILKTDENGTKWDLVAGGFRNPYAIAFNADGELFTYDSDMEWDVGLPWYRPTRVLHIVPGGEYGFREGSAKWPDYYADYAARGCGYRPRMPDRADVWHARRILPAKYKMLLLHPRLDLRAHSRDSHASQGSELRGAKQAAVAVSSHGSGEERQRRGVLARQGHARHGAAIRPGWRDVFHHRWPRHAGRALSRELHRPGGERPAARADAGGVGRQRRSRAARANWKGLVHAVCPPGCLRAMAAQRLMRRRTTTVSSYFAARTLGRSDCPSTNCAKLALEDPQVGDPPQNGTLVLKPTITSGPPKAHDSR